MASCCENREGVVGGWVELNGERETLVDLGKFSLKFRASVEQF